CARLPPRRGPGPLVRATGAGDAGHLRHAPVLDRCDRPLAAALQGRRLALDAGGVAGLRRLGPERLAAAAPARPARARALSPARQRHREQWPAIGDKLGTGDAAALCDAQAAPILAQPFLVETAMLIDFFYTLRAAK